MNPDRDPFDPTLDALLRANSDETPSPDVDAAILAAAHRAVQSAPRAAAKPAEATSPWRWWMPLAAAATIGAITIGVLQLMPKESEPSTATVISDTPPPTRAESAAPPRAKVRTDRPAPPPAANNEYKDKRTAAPEPFPAQSRDAMEQGKAAGALALPATPRAAAPAVAKQSAAAAEAPTTAPEQWVARIRALLADGKTEDAARELIAFRAAYSDADARLPAELRAWAATIKH